jgi:hypothetical protein
VPATAALDPVKNFADTRPLSEPAQLAGQELLE